MTKRDKATLRYVDFYWCMSSADFYAWINTDGDSFEFTKEVKINA